MWQDRMAMTGMGKSDSGPTDLGCTIGTQSCPLSGHNGHFLLRSVFLEPGGLVVNLWSSTRIARGVWSRLKDSGFWIRDPGSAEVTRVDTVKGVCHTWGELWCGVVDDPPLAKVFEPRAAACIMACSVHLAGIVGVGYKARRRGFIDEKRPNRHDLRDYIHLCKASVDRKMDADATTATSILDYGIMPWHLFYDFQTV